MKHTKNFSVIYLCTFLYKNISLDKKDNIFVNSNCLCQYEGRSDPKVPLGPVAFAKYLTYITMKPH